jgi:hypothetical protein
MHVPMLCALRKARSLTFRFFHWGGHRAGSKYCAEIAAHKAGHAVVEIVSASRFRFVAPHRRNRRICFGNRGEGSVKHETLTTSNFERPKHNLRSGIRI